MKHFTKVCLATASVGLLSLFGGTLQAQIIQTLSFTLTASVQSENQTDNGTTTTTPAPTKVTVTTKQILATLATDEFAAGNWSSTTFPSGAKLAAVDGDFEVLDKNNNLLVNVSNIISSSDGENEVFSGKEDDATGLASPSTSNAHILTISFDDTAINGGSNLKLYIHGVAKSTRTDTKPNATTGNYTETRSGSITGAAGEGTMDGTPFVVTGNASATGKGTLTTQ